MPKMTRRWRNTATILAVLAFLAAIYAGPVMAAINAALWFGIVYVVFLVAYGARKLARISRR
jgi:hypothetical protein